MLHYDREKRASFLFEEVERENYWLRKQNELYKRFGIVLSILWFSILIYIFIR
jgi:hypothetical protein